MRRIVININSEQLPTANNEDYYFVNGCGITRMENHVLIAEIVIILKQCNLIIFRTINLRTSRI